MTPRFEHQNRTPTVENGAMKPGARPRLTRGMPRSAMMSIAGSRRPRSRRNFLARPALSVRSRRILTSPGASQPLAPVRSEVFGPPVNPDSAGVRAHRALGWLAAAGKTQPLPECQRRPATSTRGNSAGPGRCRCPAMGRTVSSRPPSHRWRQVPPRPDRRTASMIGTNQKEDPSCQDRCTDTASST